MASILTNSVGSSQVEGGPDLAEGHSTILTKMRMYREVNWASSEGGGSLGSVGKGKVGTAKAALCVKVDYETNDNPWHADPQFLRSNLGPYGLYALQYASKIDAF